MEVSPLLSLEHSMKIHKNKVAPQTTRHHKQALYQARGKGSGSQIKGTGFIILPFHSVVIQRRQTIMQLKTQNRYFYASRTTAKQDSYVLSLLLLVASASVVTSSLLPGGPQQHRGATDQTYKVLVSLLSLIMVV